MFRELLSVFRTSDPLRAMEKNFSAMLIIAYEMVISAGSMCFSGEATPEARTELYQRDVRVNQLERQIRKQVVAHLSITGNRPDVPYSLLLVSLVKDVERIGDYAKNLAELDDVYPGALTEDETTRELQQIRRDAEESFKALSVVFGNADRERAVELIRQGRDAAHRCDALIGRIARSDYDARTTTALVLATRYYKRVGGHVLNVLSSIVMPIHKIDYYDEDEILGGVDDV
jgi:phosphate transport system protein